MATPFQDFINTELPKRPYFSGAPEDWVDGKKLVVQGPGSDFPSRLTEVSLKLRYLDVLQD